MKQCPTCKRIYDDRTLNFCLDDGEWLIGDDNTSTQVFPAVSPETDEKTLIHELNHPRGEDATITIPQAQPTSESVRPIRTKRTAAALGLLLLFALAGGAWIYRSASEKPKPQLTFQNAKLTRLTTTGKATHAAISPDGKWVVHVQDDGGQQSLWMRQTATQSNVQIIPPSTVSYDSLTFSPDGNYIYYSVSGQEYPQRVLFQVPALGGTPKKVLETLDTDPISFSPDGKQFAFVRVVPGKEATVNIAEADGGKERKLVSLNNPPESIGSPAWSPDGKRIAYVALNYDNNTASVYEANVADGSMRPLTSQRWLRVGGLSWMSDGKELLMLVSAGQQFVYQVWQLSYPDGTASRLTNDLDDYEWMSLTGDSRTLAVVKRVTQSNIWVSPLGETGQAKPVTSGAGKIDAFVSFSPDGGRVVYSSNAGGDGEDIWTVKTDGTDQKQLTSNSRINRHPTFSPDGRTIVFLSDRTGYPHLWRMNVDGEDQRQMTDTGVGEQSPRFSPDGRWIVYGTAQVREKFAWRIPSNGSGQAVQLSTKTSSYPSVSPDSKQVAYFYKEAGDAPWRIAVAAIEGGEPTKTFALPPTFDLPLRWTADGRAIAYIDTKNGVSNLLAQPLDGGPPKQLTDFKSDRIFWFDFSRDGKQVALSRGTQNSDVELISGF